MVGAEGSGVVVPRAVACPSVPPGPVQLVGRWFLVGMASRCSFLAEHSHRLEATVVTMTIGDGQSLDISTFRKL